MKQRWIFISIIFCTIILNLYQYKENKGLTNQINQLINANSDIEQIENNTKNNTGLKEGSFELELWDNYAQFPTVPAYGPLARLNSFGINRAIDKNMFKIVGKENEYFTRVSIEGFIPTWAIAEDIAKAENTVEYINDRIMYVLNDGDIFLSPTNNSMSVLSCHRGNAVTVKGEYNDFYYIHINYHVDSNAPYYGWIKKSNLGYYDSFDSSIGLDVNLKKGSPMKIGRNKEKVLTVKNHSTWGRIMEKTETEYHIRLPGATPAIINIKDVEPFSMEEK